MRPSISQVQNVCKGAGADATLWPTVRVSFQEAMAFSAKIPLLVVLVAVVCGTASAGRDRDLSRYCLPLLKNLPDTCGYVLGVVEGDTCESLA